MPGEYGNAGAALRDQGGPETGGDQEPQQREDTFFLPNEYPGAEDLQPGDTLSLRVVGKDEHGQIEVECVHDDGGKEGESGMPASRGKSVMDDMEESLN